MSNLVKSIKKLMHENDVNATELSLRCGVDKGNVSRILSGKTPNPKIETLKSIANFFDITIDQLLGDTAIPSEHTCGVVVPINRLIIPIIDWNNVSYWRQIKNQFIAKQTISVSADMSQESYALTIKTDEYQPLFIQGEVIAIDPTLQPTDRDYFINHDNQNNITDIKQLIKKNGSLYSKSISHTHQDAIKNEHLQNCYGVIIESHKSIFSRTQI